MDGSETLGNSTISQSVNAACSALAEYLGADGRSISGDDIEALPDYVFNMAVAARWLPKPEVVADVWDDVDDGSVYLGDYLVSPETREQFVALLHDTLKSLEPFDWELAQLRKAEEILRERGMWKGPEHCDDEWLKANLKISPGPTKRPTVKDRIEKWQAETGFPLEELAHQAGIGIATLYRIRAGKFSYTKHRDSLKGIAAALDCDWQEIVPKPN